MFYVFAYLLSAILLGGCSSVSTSAPDAEAVDGDGDSSSDTEGETDIYPWPGLVDGYWGEAPDRATRLQVFDEIWKELARRYAGFATSRIDWDEIHSAYRPAIEDAKSLGRFVALLNEVFLALQDGHSKIWSERVCDFSYSSGKFRQWPPLRDRPPLVVWNVRGSYIGACVTPLGDDSLLVYRVDPKNPAKLAPGDLILGYDGHPWRKLLPIVDSWQLPVCHSDSGPASSDRALDQLRMSSAVNNPHFFSRLDVVRYTDTSVVSVDVDSLLGWESDIVCPDQIAQEGVEFPWLDLVERAVNPAPVTWGILPGKDIGFIYGYGWWPDKTQTLFTTTVMELMETDGLIVDFRKNFGGNMWFAFEGLTALFEQGLSHAFTMSDRDLNSDDYSEMNLVDWTVYDIVADAQTHFDGPIAVLTGPKTYSSGEIIAYYLSHHPRARTFGRATNGSFGHLEQFWSPDPHTLDLHVSFTVAIGVDGEGRYLQGSDRVPDESVWLTQVDVATGRDSVVEAAIDWIDQVRSH